MRPSRSFFALLAAATASATLATPVADSGSVIAGRQAAFRLSGAAMGAIKGAIDRGDDVATQASAANALANWARAIPGMFPAGSDGASSRALPKVWTDRAGFEKAAGDYAASATRLAGLAKAGDKPGFAAAFGEVRKTCGACHDAYRQPEDHH